jgi:hypothetical protein
VKNDRTFSAISTRSISSSMEVAHV